MKPEDRVPAGAALAVLVLGWWAAGALSAPSLDHIACAFAAYLAARGRFSPDANPGFTTPLALPVALVLSALGALLGWAWPAALGLALILGGKGLRGWQTALMAFLAIPWIASDAVALGWAFRMSGAWIAAGFFELAGFIVERSGTFLRIEDQQIAVDAACAGMDTLQATLVVGAWVASGLATASRWWVMVLLLPLLAWLANTCRILLLSGVALTFGTEAAAGWFHSWGGVTVVGIVFVAACGLAFWLRGKERRG